MGTMTLSTIANDVIYGLAGAVFSDDRDHANRIASSLRVGKVDINGIRNNPLAPFGGYKQSGYGRTWGIEGFEEYMETKAITFA